jgi:DNA-directed RNA polymerase subunit RPC12/RpoP
MSGLAQNRFDYYKIPEVEALFLGVLNRVDEIKPVFDLKQGYRFPDVEQATGLDPQAASKLMTLLYDGQVFTRRLYDMEIRCPYCNSPNISTYYICPECNSLNIKKNLLIEHLKCGYLGPLESVGSGFNCPKCGEKIQEGEYRNIGSIYDCADCKEQIETPLIGHWCRDCDKRFNFDNGIYQSVYSYSQSEATRHDISSGILYLRNVTEMVAELGFTKIPNTKVLGESGVERSFDIGFDRKGEVIFIDLLASSEPIGEIEFVKEYGKIVDSKKNVYLIIMPNLDEKATLIAQVYKSNIVFASTPGEALDKLRTLIMQKVTDIKIMPKTVATQKKGRFR